MVDNNNNNKKRIDCAYIADPDFTFYGKFSVSLLPFPFCLLSFPFPPYD